MARKRDWLYNTIDWLWTEVPGFRSLHDDTKAILSYLAFNGMLVLCVVGAYKILGLF